MKIAIIGTGISGLTAAYYLHRQHDVVLFEARPRIGGHTHTVEVSDRAGNPISVDTGFIVFNNRTYPNFCRLMDELGVGSHETTMSFSVRCDHSGLEYRGKDLNGLFAQRSNLLRPSHYRMLRDMLRFHRKSREVLQSDSEELTVNEFFQREKFGKRFVEKYFMPMGSAIWSCPMESFGKFPIRFIVEFYRNHGLLAVNDIPQWRVVEGGSHSYLGPLTAGFHRQIRTSSAVTSIHRTPEQVLVTSRGHAEPFQHVVFACHSDQSLRILGDQATPLEREVLAAFPYEENVAILHTDTSVLPRRKNAWACWNYHLAANRDVEGPKATVTYNMNMLQGLAANETYCVTLNRESAIDPARVIGRYVYHHPVFSTRRQSAQARHGALIDQNRTSYCGAYWGNGFHEDGVASALAVCRKLLSETAGGARREQLFV